MVFQVLNRLKWTGRLKDCEIVIISRGAPDDRLIIKGSEITELKRSYFCYGDKIKALDTVIPLHRVVEIRCGRKSLWQRKPAKAER